MKKFVKLSLAAAVAVSGMSFANAASLEESIKNIDVSGSARLRFHTVEKGAATDDFTRTAYTVDIANKVSDDTTVTVGFYAKGVDTASNNAGLNDQVVNLGAFNVTNTAIANTTIIAGKQALATPFTVAWDPTGTDFTGTGILVVNSSTPATIIAGYMDQTNIAGFDGELAIAGITGKVAGVGLQAWRAKVESTTNNSITAGFYKADYAMDLDGVKLGMYAQYSTGEIDLAGQKENTVTQLGLSAKSGIFAGDVKYMKIGKNGSTVAFDGSAPALAGGFEGLDIHGNSAAADKSSYRIHASAQALASLKLGVWHIAAEELSTAAGDSSETVVYGSWAMAKGTKLTTYVGQSDDTGVDQGTITRIQLDYKF